MTFIKVKHKQKNTTTIIEKATLEVGLNEPALQHRSHDDLHESQGHVMNSDLQSAFSDHQDSDKKRLVFVAHTKLSQSFRRPHELHGPLFVLC